MPFCRHRSLAVGSTWKKLFGTGRPQKERRNCTLLQISIQWTLAWEKPTKIGDRLGDWIKNIGLPACLPALQRGHLLPTLPKHPPQRNGVSRVSGLQKQLTRLPPHFFPLRTRWFSNGDTRPCQLIPVASYTFTSQAPSKDFTTSLSLTGTMEEGE